MSMESRTLGEKAGDKLEEGLGQVKERATKAGIHARNAARARTGHGPTKDQLYADAKRLGIKGRSKMTKSELEKAVRQA
ncbi:hypothetical protein AB0H36_03690 [Kribbella sp. NPDC050820]|uniref:hypothetical protein n=1 Tax=Kribbella sp. NPDC050820 TaxID=3155408 RepID=UPI0033C4D318